ncbi:DMT family transporter [Winogradskyella jejuensis]|uniref:Permease of the drug/metabolite transporter (DMT) superfamily n=1 Tax=Winogradskyella jejuensis TaxID=1089305 RepID=A0A1M5NE31_9FLAO|nr:EamA family transporter [Winogradskyella jejuensis]SHG87768.1 Permease of the drug/metabolite transporter (DMT) superfamily [Winogradskyella jejuensis]
MKNINTKWLYLIILSIIWGSSFILIKKSLLGLTPFQIGSLRNVLTGGILLIFGYSSLKQIKKPQWKWIAISGFLGSFFPAFLFAIAETEIDSAVTSILNSLVPLNTVLMGVAVFKITSTRRQVFGIIVGFIGTAILILKGSEINPNQNYLYAGFIIISTLMYAANVNIIKRYLQDVKPLTIAAGNYVFIIVPALIVLLFTDFFSASTFNSETIWTAILCVIILSVFGTALAKVLFNKLIQISSPVFATSVTYLMPIVAVIWGLLDGEAFTPMQGIATLIILTGVYISNTRKT